MLGHSDAGKTTYMSLMYEMMGRGVGGFVVSAENPDDHVRLSAAAKAIRTGRYPPVSDQRHEYRLHVRHGQSDLLTFGWRDYRGGALLDRSTAQKAQVITDLREADGIVVFVDAPDLARNQRARSKTRSLVFHIVRALEGRSKPTPLVLAYTKCDLFDTDLETRLLDEPFQPLVDAVKDDGQVFGAKMYLACGPEPFNVPGPVLWCLFFGIASRAGEVEERLNVLAAARNRAKAGDTLSNRISAWWNGQESNRGLALRHQRQLEAEMQRLEPLLEPAERLWSYVREVTSF